MQFPKLLKPGDTILLIAPSSPLRSGTAQSCAEGLKKEGYNVRLGKSVNSSSLKGYAAAPAQLRAEDINNGFADDSIDALWAVRGGSMAAEVLPYLNTDLIAKHPKPLFGFSDITAIHAVLQGKCDMVSFHAPCASSFSGDGPNAYAMDTFRTLMNMQDTYKFRNAESHPYRILQDGHAEGTLIGGNMTLVTSLIGTDYALQTEGRILFLEDVDEDVYRLNRMLIQLKQSGMLDAAAGLLFGDFTNCNNGYNAEYRSDDLLKEFFADYQKPVYYNLSVGHIPENGILPLGAHCVMDNGTIAFTH